MLVLRNQNTLHATLYPLQNAILQHIPTRHFDVHSGYIISRADQDMKFQNYELRIRISNIAGSTIGNCPCPPSPTAKICLDLLRPGYGA